MSDSRGTIEQLASLLSNILLPLETRLSARPVDWLLDDMGLRVPPEILQQSGLADSANSLVPALSALRQGLDNLSDVSSAIVLLARIKDVIDSVYDIASRLSNASGGTQYGPRIGAFASQFPVQLLNLLIVDWIEAKAPTLVRALGVAGILDDCPQGGDPSDPTAPPFTLRRFRIDLLMSLLSDPKQFVQDAFGLGIQTFDGCELFRRLKVYLDRAGLPAAILTPPGLPAILEGGLFRCAVDTQRDPLRPGLAFRLRVPATADYNESLPLAGPWALVIGTKGRFDGGLEAAISPDLDISLKPPTGTASVDLQIGLEAGDGATPFTLLGVAGATRLEVAKLSGMLGIQAAWNSEQDQTSATPTVEIAATGLKGVIDLSSGDGFLKQITGGRKLETNLDLKARWSPSNGLQFEGSGGIDIAIPCHVAVGPVEFSNVHILGRLSSSNGLSAEVTAGLSAALGPVKVAVDGVGIVAAATFPAGSRNLGLFQLDIGFKPPSGVGIAIDAGMVKGGGFLFIDPERGEYSGALQLMFAEIVSLNAIGIITTRMPDGSSGFSLLVIISVGFGTGIQLGFGFTLLAVGGLVGCNRTMRLQPLLDGVRTGSTESVMFPSDIIANAPAIISDLRNYFPAQDGIFLIGPMAKLGWGTPPLVTATVGVIIEIPGNIAILGVVKVVLPNEKAPLLQLQVNFFGAIEFDKKRLYFFASLFDSRLIFLTIEGEMGLLAAFGDDANFVISVGGFHPSFSPPPLPFPVPNRTAINIINTDYARIRVESYFAVTPNTPQCGAAAQLFFGFSAINIQGHVAFDALFQFSPFHFIIALSASFSLNVFGAGLFSVRIAGSLEGPAPWRVRGTGSITILFFITISADFDVSFGEGDDSAALETAKVMEMLTNEIGKRENWKAYLPPQSNLGVTLRALPEEDALVLHPLGVLRVSQRALPLGITLDKVGSKKPGDVNFLSMDVAGSGLVKTDDVMERFPIAQFQELSDNDKLSCPAYQPLVGGAELAPSGGQVVSSRMVKRVVRYEQSVIDGSGRAVIGRFVDMNPFLFNFFTKKSSVRKCALSKAAKKKLDPFGEKLRMVNEAFSVVWAKDNKAYNAASAAFPSEARARRFLTEEMAKNPKLAGELQVIPAFERAA